MSEQGKRYFILPMIIIFILGIAAINILKNPIVSFFIISLAACLCGLISGLSYQLVKFIVHTLNQVREKRALEKETSAEYHKA
ncbi:hypothetical protein [Listeria sp. PSOL-1]|uniref:hypothetical protein n=1 Tax=Listeria sp. PSOL-1 TaxID=1844999 RepID=UPI0013D4E3B2|nr:hypothetical protein [Listeria sp. PSOL-1]